MKHAEPTRVLAIRHGETAWNVDTRLQGKLNIALNSKGRRQAASVGLALAQEQEPIAAIYSSDLSRAHDTALAISKETNVAIKTDVGLQERGFGVFEGKTLAEAEVLWPNDVKLWRQRDPDFCPDGGESLRQFKARVLQAAQARMACHPGEQVVIVAHGGVLDVLYREATGQSIEAPRTWVVGNAVINRFLWTPQGYTLVGWHDARHLDDGVLAEAHA